MKFSQLTESFYNLFKNRQTRQILAGLMLGLFLALGSAPVFSQVPPADPGDPQQLVREAEQLDRAGQWQQALGNLRDAAAIFTQSQNKEHLAVTLANIGRIQLRVGRYQEALNTWNETRKHYDRDRFPNFNRRITVYEVRALQALGHDLKACDRLDSELNFSPRFAEELNATESQVLPNLRVCQNETFPSDEKQIIIAIQNILESDKFKINANSINATGWQNFGEVLQVLGKLELSETVLEQLELLLADLDTNESAVDLKVMRATTLLSLGNTLRARGNLERDRQSPPKYDYMPWRCEEIDNNAALPAEATIFYNGGYDKKTNQPIKGAKEFYQDAIDLSEPSSSKIVIQAKLNLLTLILETAQPNKLVRARELLAELKGDRSLASSTLTLSDLPPSQSKVYTEIKLAKSQNCLNQLEHRKPQWLEIEHQLQTALRDAKNLNDDLEDLNDNEEKRNNNDALSFVLGNMGGFDEYRALWLEKHLNISQFVKQETQLELCQNTTSCRQEAQYLTHKALSFAQPAVKPHIAYQWQWQLGRLSAIEGKREKAISFYESAAKTLDSVRSDLLSINSDVQFNFRDNVEPVYRGLVGLLLPTGETQPSPENLWKAIYYIDSLRLAELSNFLKCDLGSDAIAASLTQSNANKNPVKLLERKIKEILVENPTMALVYPIIFEDKIGVIVKTSLKENPLYYPTIPPQDTQEKLPEQSVREIIDNKIVEARNKLTHSVFPPESAKPLEDLYKWFMLKFISDLKEEIDREIINTLVFVLDDSLQSIPMAALHNGENFVVQENYHTVVTPTVQILDANRDNNVDLTALIAGSTVPMNGINSNRLEAGSVQSQIKIVSEFFPTHKILFEKENLIFTKDSFQKEIQSSNYNVVHLVTHGEFSSDPEATIIVTEDKSNPFINMNDFRKILSNRDSSQPIELLVLSACETSSGDKRATLGIAGVAVASGANGTIAPLWDVDQESTGELIKRFYKNLVNGDGMSKAKALHQAQKSLRDEIENPNLSNPSHWAPFILVGN